MKSPKLGLFKDNGHPTENISEFVDFHLRPHVKKLPSFIKDTTDYLQKIQGLNHLPPNTTLVTMDVTSLHINIPHSDDIEACREYGNLGRSNIHSDCLVTFLKMV